MNPVVEEIKSRINVVDLLSEYLKLQKAGSNWRANCPFHREKTPSFMVSEEKQIWHCFGCAKGGDIFGFLMEMEGLEFKEALKILADKAGVALSEYRGSKESGINKDKIYEILETSAKFFEKQLWDGMGKEKIREYLKKRGLKEKISRDFRIGYAPPGWKNIMDFLIGRGYSIEDISKTGLLVEKTDNINPDAAISEKYYDRFRDRIMFPIADIMGRIIGFSARVSPGGDEKQAKYVNTPETIVYHKSRILYGIDRAKQEIKNEKFALVVEGNTDVIAAYQAGVKNTVAVSGTALTPEQLDVLKRYSNNIKLLFDMDEAGEEALKRSISLCFQKDMNVSVVRLTEGKDAAELVEKDASKFIECVKNSQNAMEYLLKGLLEKYDKGKPEDKKAIVKDSLEIVKDFSSKIEKSHWIKRISKIVDVEEGIIEDSLRELKIDSHSSTVKEKETSDTSSKLRPGEKSRERVIKEKILGLMLADPLTWERAVEDLGDNVMLISSPLLSDVIKKGPSASYEIDKLLSLTEDEKIKDLMQKIYFETKYNFSDKSEIEEAALSDPWFQLQECIQELEMEQKRNRLKKLHKDIKKAEKFEDKDSLHILVSEFSKLSKELK